MNSLTILGLLPLVGSAALFLLPKGSNLLAKQVALGVSIVVAIAGLGMAFHLIALPPVFNLLSSINGFPLSGLTTL